MLDTAPIAFEWLSIDEENDQSPVAFEDIAATFRGLGAAGFATWRPYEGFNARIAMQRGRIVGFDGSIVELAQLAADRLGAVVAWGGDSAETGVAEPREPRPGQRVAARPYRWMSVLPSTLSELAVASWLPSGLMDPSRLPLERIWELDGRAVIVRAERSSLAWALRVRPVVTISMLKHGIVLEVSTTTGHQNGRRSHWYSGWPDLRREWFSTVDFSADPAWSEQLHARQLAEGRNELSRLTTIERVMDELGRPDGTADRLARLSEAPYSDGLLSELVELLGLPMGLTALARGEEVENARELGIERGWLRGRRLRRRDRALVD